MNALELLKADHRVVDALFKKIEDTTPSKYAPIFKKIKNELDTHAHIEEKLFYPKLKKEGKKDLVDIVLEGLEEHAQMKKFLREVDKLTAKSEKYAPKIMVLIEDTRHHVREEENEMFPLVREQFSDEQLEKLGEQLMQEKEKYQKANGIKPLKPAETQGIMATMAEGAKKLVTDILDAGQEQPNGKASGAKKSASGQSNGKSTRSTASGRGPAKKSSTGSGKSTRSQSGASAK